jgi:hypothetical protein
MLLALAITRYRRPQPTYNPSHVRDMIAMDNSINNYS